MKQAVKHRSNKLSKWVLLSIVFTALFSSCGINSDIMFKSPKDEVRKVDSLILSNPPVYKINKDDKITFSVEPNEGLTLINNNGSGNMSQGLVLTNDFLVQQDGTMNLPLLGDLKVLGMTIRQLEDTLKQRYSKYINQPFVRAKVTNQRVIVFPGRGSDARVVPLTNSQTTLLEVLASVGGIADRGKASTIKLLREVDSVRTVHTIDLSVMDNLAFADVIVVPNDYIYVEPNEELVKETYERVVPVIGILANLILVVSLILNF